MTDALNTLTEKEKETLRLILRGHDAKSSARQLDISVHTINERLRVARRKLAVTSSREAARLLFAEERGHLNSLVDMDLGEAAEEKDTDRSQLPNGHRGDGHAARRILAWSVGGSIVMSIFLALFLFASPVADPGVSDGIATRAKAVTTADSMSEVAARSWLELVDAGDWQASLAAAGSAFREQNTLESWRAASLEARVPLGALEHRDLVAVDYVAAPPAGYTIVRFKSVFTKRGKVIEAVTLQREGSGMKVVGYTITDEANAGM